MEGWGKVSSLVSFMYKHYRLVLEKEELASFLEYFQQANVVSDLKKDCNERLILTVWKEECEQISLYLESQNNRYIIHQSIETTNPLLEDIIHQTIALFKATALIEHQLSESAMLYYYEDGIMHKIIEKARSYEKVIYDYPTQFFFEKKVENIKKQINVLLDKRNAGIYQQDISQIDQQLKELSNQIKKQN